MLTTPKLTLKADCADLRDFYQYYRGRYFGLKTDTDKVLSACIDPNVEMGNNFQILTYDTLNRDAVVPMVMTWARVQKECSFGSPVLGNVLNGPHYTYLYTYGYRESIKGLGLSSVEYHVPSATFFTKWGQRHQEFLVLLDGTAHASREELALVWNTFNKTYFTFGEAISILERGMRIGCPLNKSVGLYFHEGFKDIQLSYKTFDRVGAVKESQGEYRVELKYEYLWLQPVLASLLPDYVTLRGANA